MAYQKRPNTGTLGKNDHKKEDNHPDYTGKLDVDGKAYRISGWIKKSSDGRKFLSIAVRSEEEMQVSREEKAHGKDLGGRPGKHAGMVPGNQNDPDDQIPF